LALVNPFSAILTPSGAIQVGGRARSIFNRQDAKYAKEKADG